MEFAAAVQHVLVLYTGIVLVPVMLTDLYRIPAGETHNILFLTTMCAAIGTLMQVVRIGRFGLGRAMFMGTSAAYLSCSHTALELGGMALLSNMVLLTAPVQFLFAFAMRHVRRIITPAVGGVVIMLAVTGLLQDAAVTWTGNPALTGERAWERLVSGLMVVAVMLAVEWLGRRRLRPWSLVLGIVAGGLVSAVFGHWDLSRVTAAAWTGLPPGTWHGFVFQPTPQHWTLLFTFSVAVLVTSIKYTGDAMALHRVEKSGTRKVDLDAIQGGLYANGVAALLAGLSGGMPSTSHSPNIPLAQLTGICTRRVAVMGALMLAAVALCPKASMLLMSVPESVLGAAGVVLVGHLFATGMRMAAGGGLNFRNGFIVGLSLSAGLMAGSGRFFPNLFPEALVPFTSNGFAVGGVVAVLLTLFTEFGVDRGIVLRVRVRVADLDELKRGIREAVLRFGMTKTAAARLELACEEVFMHFVDRMDSGHSGHVAFRLRDGGERICVEAACGVHLPDLETAKRPDMSEVGSMDSESLRTLGLFLLGKVAENISHVHIAGSTYVGFAIRME